MTVNIQSPIFTSYLLCVVYTVLAFLTDNKNVKCARMCICEICVCMGGIGTKPRPWTLDSGLDSGLDYGLDYGLDFGLNWTVLVCHFKQTMNARLSIMSGGMA